MSVETHSEIVAEAVFFKKDDVWVGTNLLLKIFPYFLRLFPATLEFALRWNFKQQQNALEEYEED